MQKRVKKNPEVTHITHNTTCPNRLINANLMNYFLCSFFCITEIIDIYSFVYIYNYFMKSIMCSPQKKAGTNGKADHVFG